MAGRGSRQHVNGTRCRPVLAFVVSARDKSQSCARVSFGRTRQDSSRWICLRQSSGNTAHAPCATEVQTVEVDQLGIGSVGNNRRIKQGFNARQPRQKSIKPASEPRLI